MAKVIIEAGWEVTCNQCGDTPLRPGGRYLVKAVPTGVFVDLLGQVCYQDSNPALPALRAVAEKRGLKVEYGSFGHFISGVPAADVADVAEELAAALIQEKGLPAKPVGSARRGHPIHPTANRCGDEG